MWWCLDGWGAGRPKRKEGEWGEPIETNWSRDGLRLKSDNLRRCCRLQDRGAVQGQSESRWCDIAHRRGGREARLAGVVASGWLKAGRPRRKEGGRGEGPSLAITTMVCSEFA